jgi:VWFA-related protein
MSGPIVRSIVPALAIVCAAGAMTSAIAQSTKGVARGMPQHPFTLTVHSRIVLMDVTVTDSSGNPVRGLPQSDFRVLDDGHPQQIVSFKEHDEHPAEQAAVEPVSVEKGTYSNGSMLHLHAPANVLLIDTTTIGIADQMFLYEELTKFVQQLPPGEPVAVFTRAGDVTVQLQSFTANHALLLDAIRKAVPHLQMTGAYALKDSDTLRQMAYYLSQVPGRKNVLWFTGGSNMYLTPQPGAFESPQMRDIYDMLEAERIALYPIDVRGITLNTNLNSMAAQQSLMQREAKATGGSAYVDLNNVQQATARIVATDGDYYTLTYSPNDLRNDGRWHRVKVQLVHPGYQLSYRRGYFDDGTNGGNWPGKARMLKKDGIELSAPNARSQPISFTAQVLPISLRALAAEDPADAKQVKHGKRPYGVHYSVTAQDIAPQNVKGDRATDVVAAAILAFDRYGDLLARKVQKISVEVNENLVRNAPHAVVTFNQTIVLPKGQNFVFLAVWDAKTGRMGMMTVPVNILPPAKEKKAN